MSALRRTIFVDHRHGEILYVEIQRIPHKHKQKAGEKHENTQRTPVSADLPEFFANNGSEVHVASICLKSVDRQGSQEHDTYTNRQGRQERQVHLRTNLETGSTKFEGDSKHLLP